MAQKILITGGAGFVGRHFCKYFLEKGDDVYCVDNLVPLTGGLDPNVVWPLYCPRDYKNFHWKKADCRDFFDAHGVLQDIDLVIHLAAIVGGREMIEGNPLAVADDLSIDAAFWQWAVKAQPKKIICFSSSAVYPIDCQTKEYNCPLPEYYANFKGKDVGLPDMSYGWAKLTHEYLAKLAYEKHGLKSIIYRPFSGYGEDQDLAYPFPAICSRLFGSPKNLEQFQVWGTGDQVRDFIHIDDVVWGTILTKDKIDDANALNLCTGIGTSFKKFASMAANLRGYNSEVVGMSNKPEGVFARVGAIEEQTRLGFSAKITLEEGTRRMFEYLEKKKLRGVA